MYQVESADSIALMHRLGQLLWRFRPGFWAILREILFGLLLLFPASLFSLGVLAALTEIPNPVDGGWLTGVVIMALITLGFLSASGYYFYRAVQLSKYKIVFYEQGIVTIQEQKVQVGRYEKITILQRIVRHHLGRFLTIPVFHVGTDYFITIEFPDRTQAKARDRRVYELLQEQVYQSQYPQVITDYHEGREIDFREIKISQQGLTVGGETCSWSAVANIKLHNGTIIVKPTGGGWFNQMTVQASEVPNLFILLALLKQICPVGQFL